jgi:hypothetical protein
MNLLTLSLALVTTLIAQPVCALVINVASNGSTTATLADIKQNPNAAVSLTQALALLKDPAPPTSHQYTVRLTVFSGKPSV